MLSYYIYVLSFYNVYYNNNVYCAANHVVNAHNRNPDVPSLKLTGILENNYLCLFKQAKIFMESRKYCTRVAKEHRYRRNIRLRIQLRESARRNLSEPEPMISPPTPSD